MMQKLPKTWTLPYPRMLCARRSATLALLLAALLALSTFEGAFARHSPNRHDRRPDRETRISYPRSTRQSTTRRAVTIHSESPAAAPAATPDSPNDEDAGTQPPASQAGE